MAIAAWAVLCVASISDGHPILGALCLVILVGCAIRAPRTDGTPPADALDHVRPTAPPPTCPPEL